MDRNVLGFIAKNANSVALRKESVDRNADLVTSVLPTIPSLSARRAWIEINSLDDILAGVNGRSPQGERG